MQKLTDRQRQAMEQIEQRGKGKQQPQSEAYYFLSFSIPDEPIKRMISQASHYKIPATVRGLIENNMEKTTAKMFELVKDNNQGAWLSIQNRLSVSILMLFPRWLFSVVRNSMWFTVISV